MAELFSYFFISSVLTGICILVYIVLTRIFRKRLSIRLRSLWTHLLLFLQPAIIVGSSLSQFSKRDIAAQIISIENLDFSVNTVTVYVLSKASNVIISTRDFADVIGKAWFALAFILICFKVIRYIRFKRLLMSRAVISHNFIRPKLVVAKCNVVIAPLLIGVIRAVMVLPECGLSSDELKFAIKHELTHYRRRDIIFKMLAEVLKTVNFFNPVFCLIQKELNNVCEMMTDEETLMNASYNKRKMYCGLLLSLAEKRNDLNAFGLNLSSNGKILAERIGLIMNNIKHEPIKKMSIIITTLAAILLLSITAYAAVNIAPKSITAEEGGIPQKPISGFSLLNETGSKLPEKFVSCGDDFIPYWNMYSVNGKLSNNTYTVEKLAYGNGQMIVLTNDSGNGFELNKNQEVTIQITPNYSPEYNNDKENGELVSVGYILDGAAIEIDTATGRVPEKGLEINFIPTETGTYYFYAINCCAGLQNYEKINVEII